jgi:AcrR family transcriptional regulator
VARQQRAIETRSTIIDTAAVVFARRGYVATSFSELVSESGLTKGAFYFHFSSKEELALETMRVKQEQLITRILADVPPDARGLDRLAASLRARARALEDDESLWCVLRLGAELGAVSGPTSEYAQLNEWPILLFAELIEEGQHDDAVRRDLDPRATGEAVFAAVIGMDALASQLTGGRDLAARTEHLLDILQTGLTDTPPKGRPSGRRPRTR